jgi:hypothetical protein
MLHQTNTAQYELSIKNGQPVVYITQLKIEYTLGLDANDFLNLLNVGEGYMKTIDGHYLTMHFNQKNGHLRTEHNNDINTYLPSRLMQNALKKELTDLISATYSEEKGLPC